MITREEALKILKENIKDEKLFKHSLAVEAIMRELACVLRENEERWGITGLLHDIDYEKTKNDFSQHSILAEKMLSSYGLDEEICRAVKVHNEIHGFLPETKMEKALLIADAVSGLIIASVLVLPSKKIKDLTLQSLIKHFKEKSFARGANREVISKSQEYLNLSLEKFLEISVQALKKIDKILSL